MRTQQQILDKMKEVKSHDWLGTMKNDLVLHLTYENAKPFLREDVTEEQWLEAAKSTDEQVITEMKDYLGFAFEKARGQRGISASRSMDHYYIWIWLLGKTDELGDVQDYSDYGIKNLNRIKKFLEKQK